MKEDISFLDTDCPGLSSKAPMAIVQRPIVREDPSIPNGWYSIKNKAADIYWNYINGSKSNSMVNFASEGARDSVYYQVNEHSPIIQMFIE